MRLALLLSMVCATPASAQIGDYEFVSDIAYSNIDEYNYENALDFVARELAKCVSQRGEAACVRLDFRLAEASLFSLDYDRSHRLARKALDLTARHRPEEDSWRADATFFLGKALYQKGQFAAAENHLREALTLIAALPDTDPIELAQRLALLADTLESQGRFHHAHIFYRRAFDAVRQAPGDDPSASIRIATDLGRSFAMLGDLEAAKNVLEALAPLSADNPPMSPDLARANLYLAQIALVEGDLEEAGRRHLYAATATLSDADRRTHIRYYQTGADIFDLQGEVELAAGYLRDGYRRSAAMFPPSDSERTRAAALYGEYLLDRSINIPLARTMLRQATAGTLQRTGNYTDFNAAAQFELRDYRPALEASVHAAWRLANR